MPISYFHVFITFYARTEIKSFWNIKPKFSQNHFSVNQFFITRNMFLQSIVSHGLVFSSRIKGSFRNSPMQYMSAISVQIVTASPPSPELQSRSKRTNAFCQILFVKYFELDWWREMDATTINPHHCHLLRESCNKCTVPPKTLLTKVCLSAYFCSVWAWTSFLSLKARI